MPPGSVPAPATPEFHVTAANAARLDLEIARRAPEHVFVHAGVVCVGASALLLPGRSYSGKSTLVKALTDLGAVYYSDEYAVLDANGLVLPYPCPLKLRPQSASLSLQGGDKQVPVRFVLQCRYAGNWAVENGTAGRAWLALFQNAVAARLDPLRVATTVRAACRGVHFAAGVRDDAEQAARRLMNWVQGGSL